MFALLKEQIESQPKNRPSCARMKRVAARYNHAASRTAKLKKQMENCAHAEEVDEDDVARIALLTGNVPVSKMIERSQELVTMEERAKMLWEYGECHRRPA